MQGATEGHPPFLLAGPVMFIYAFWSVCLILCVMCMCVYVGKRQVSSPVPGLRPWWAGSPDDSALRVSFSCLS